MTEKKIKLIIAIGLITIGITTRLLVDLKPNFEFITAITLASGYFFPKSYKFLIVPITILLVTDLVIGNSLIFLFTWSGFIFGFFMSKFSSNYNPASSSALSLFKSSTVLGFLSTTMFFLWTNFGVVVTSNMYERSITGLIQSYANALPFLKNQLTGNLLLVPSIFLLVHVVILSARLYTEKDSNKQKNIKF